MEKALEIRKRIEQVRLEIPADVEILAAAKKRTLDEVLAAHEAGIKYFGHNYIQEARAMIPNLDIDVEWHLIGHLQRNKARSAVELFDIVESLDSMRLGRELEKFCGEMGKRMPVLIEVNSGHEENKTGVMPEDVILLAKWLSEQKYLHLIGLMTMGPLSGDSEFLRPFYKETRRLFDEIGKLSLPNTDLKILSMGMSNSYRVAIEEGATLVRLGTQIFGPRAV